MINYNVVITAKTGSVCTYTATTIHECHNMYSLFCQANALPIDASQNNISDDMTNYDAFCRIMDGTKIKITAK